VLAAVYDDPEDRGTKTRCDLDIAAQMCRGYPSRADLHGNPVLMRLAIDVFQLCRGKPVEREIVRKLDYTDVELPRLVEQVSRRHGSSGGCPGTPIAHVYV